METLEILTVLLGVLFGLGLLFSILLWCRSWRQEEAAEHARTVEALREEVAHLQEAVDLLDQTAAALQAADERLALRIESLGTLAGRIYASPPPAARVLPPKDAPPRPETPAPPAGPTVADDRYARVRALLSEGKSEIDIAKTLGIGPAEVRMIARVDAPGPQTHSRRKRNLAARG